MSKKKDLTKLKVDWEPLIEQLPLIEKIIHKVMATFKNKYLSFDEVQGSVVFLLAKNNYVAKWDPDRGVPMMNYLYKPIRLHIISIIRAQSKLHATFVENVDFASEAKYVKHSVDVDVFIDAIIKRLVSYDFVATVIYNKRTHRIFLVKRCQKIEFSDPEYIHRDRSILYVFRCLRHGFTQTEIARRLCVSDNWVSKKSRMIRSIIKDVVDYETRLRELR